MARHVHRCTVLPIVLAIGLLKTANGDGIQSNCSKASIPESTLKVSIQSGATRNDQKDFRFRSMYVAALNQNERNKNFTDAMRLERGSKEFQQRFSIDGDIGDKILYKSDFGQDSHYEAVRSVKQLRNDLKLTSMPANEEEEHFEFGRSSLAHIDEDELNGLKLESNRILPSKQDLPFDETTPNQESFISKKAQSSSHAMYKRSADTHSGSPRYHAFHRHLYEFQQNTRSGQTPTRKPLQTVSPYTKTGHVFKRFPNPLLKPPVKIYSKFQHIGRRPLAGPEVNLPPLRSPIPRVSSKSKSLQKHEISGIPDSHRGSPRYHAFHRHLYTAARPISQQRKSPIKPFVVQTEKLRHTQFVLPTITSKPFTPRQPVQPPISILPESIISKTYSVGGGSHRGDSRYHAFHRHLYNIGGPVSGGPETYPKLSPRLMPVEIPPLLKSRPLPTRRPISIPKRIPATIAKQFPSLKQKVVPTLKPIPRPPFDLKIHPRQGGGTHRGDPKYHAFHRHLYGTRQQIPKRVYPTAQPSPGPITVITSRPYLKPSRVLPLKPILRPLVRQNTTPTKYPSHVRSHGGDSKYHAFHRHLHTSQVAGPTKYPIRAPPSRKRPLPLLYNKAIQRQYPIAVPKRRTNIILSPIPKRSPIPHEPILSERPGKTSRLHPTTRVPRKYFGNEGSHRGEPRYHAFHRHLYDADRPTVKPAKLYSLSPLQPVYTEKRNPIPIPTSKPFLIRREKIPNYPEVVPSRNPVHGIIPISNPPIKMSDRTSGGSHTGSSRYHAFHRHLYNSHQPLPQTIH